MNYWFQSSDFVSKDLDIHSFEEFLDLIKQFDYKDDKEILDKLISQKEDYCPFGFGITTDTSLIHLTYDFDKEKPIYQIYESYEVKKKLLGLFSINSTDDKNSTFKSIDEVIQALKKLAV